MNGKMKFQIALLKFRTWVATVLSFCVVNFHKKVPGIKTIKNISYTENTNKYQKFDIHYHSNQNTKLPIIIYFHGGGWTAYSKSIFTTLTRRLAKMGYVVFNCNYSLAPKYKIGTILHDSSLAIRKARDLAESYGGNPDKIILAGDSAGAHISVMTMLNALNGKEDLEDIKEKIQALILFYGVYNLKTMLNTGFANIKTYAAASVEGGIKNDKMLEKYSPILYDVSSFPPCFLASGAIDKLHQSQSMKMYKKLQESGVKTDKIFFDKDESKALHSYMIIDGLSTNVQTLEKIEKFLGEINR